MIKFLFPVSIVVLLISCENQPRPGVPDGLDRILEKGEWIDLTYDFSEGTLYWPSVTNTFHLDTISYGKTPGGYFYSAYSYSAPEHGGTHLDAPVHFAKGKMAADEIPLEQLMGNAIVVDVSENTLTNHDYQITVDDIITWEKSYGRIPDDCIILFRTGFGNYYPDAGTYLGTTMKGDSGVANLHFPGISPALASWLVKNRKVKAVGIDTASIDFGQSTEFKTHQTFYNANIPGFENVANLDRLPDTSSFVIAMPMKIKGGSGAPLRIMAWLRE